MKLNNIQYFNLSVTKFLIDLHVILLVSLHVILLVSLKCSCRIQNYLTFVVLHDCVSNQRHCVSNQRHINLITERQSMITVN